MEVVDLEGFADDRLSALMYTGGVWEGMEMWAVRTD